MIPTQTPLISPHFCEQTQLFPYNSRNPAQPNRLIQAISAASEHCGNYNLASDGHGIGL